MNGILSVTVYKRLRWSKQPILYRHNRQCILSLFGQLLIRLPLFWNNGSFTEMFITISSKTLSHSTLIYFPVVPFLFRRVVSAPAAYSSANKNKPCPVTELILRNRFYSPLSCSVFRFRLSFSARRAFRSASICSSCAFHFALTSVISSLLCASRAESSSISCLWLFCMAL